MTDGTPRISASYVAWLAERCSIRDRNVLQTLNRLRLASGIQLERLHFADLIGRSRSVTRWRVLRRLTDWRLITTLERRVGGSARGSAGMVFALDSAGVRLLKLNAGQRVRRPPALGDRKVKHSLAVGELYVDLTEHSRTHGFGLTCFEVEPRYPTSGGWLSPDAYAVITTREVTDHWWIEVDRATESPATIERKIDAYVTYYQQSRWTDLGIMPRVLVTVPDERRRMELADRLLRSSSIARKLVEISLQQAASSYLALTITNSHS